MVQQESFWKPVSWLEAAVVSTVIAILAWAWLTSPGHWVRVVDDANLVFHEAGHPIFGLFGPWVGLIGGTLGQLFFPAVAAFQFWLHCQPSAFAVACAWFFENLLNISRYMADARTQVLPLVGSGEHDWTRIFGAFHVLPHDTAIAGVVEFIGLVGLASCVAWLFYRAAHNVPEYNP